MGISVPKDLENHWCFGRKRQQVRTCHRSWLVNKEINYMYYSMRPNQYDILLHLTKNN